MAPRGRPQARLHTASGRALNAWVAVIDRAGHSVTTASSSMLPALLRILAEDAETADPKWLRIEIGYR